jgi:Na+/H+-dicarboxylate symporter
MSRLRRPSLTVQILIGLALGIACGLACAHYHLDTKNLGEVGKLIIQAIKVAATPLLLLAIVNAILTAEVRAKSGARMMVLATMNASIALALGLALSNIFKPGRHLASITEPVGKSVTAEPLELVKVRSTFVPASLVQPFADNALLTLVIMALLVGIALRRLKSAGEDTAGLERAAGLLMRAAETILGWIIQLVPIAVFAVVAKAVSERGFEHLPGLAWYVGVGLLGLTLHPLITYQLWLVLFARMPLRTFWREAREPITYAAGANSSLATLPLTLKALERLRVSKASAVLGACVGTNLNNDGIILYEGMAVLFVAQAHGLNLSLQDQILAAFSCMVAAMGIAGVPEAGFVSLAVVLATVKLPLELLPLLLTVDWIIARGRSVVNVLSDMMVSILLDRWDGRRFDEEPSPAAALDVA